MNAPMMRLLPATIIAIVALLGVKSLELVRAAVPPVVDQQARAPSPVATSSKPPASPASAPTSDADQGILQGLRQRREELDEREHALAQREAMLSAAEQKLDQRIAELQDLQRRLEDVSSARRQRQDAAWTSLVKLYEAMKPRDAANIFNDLDMPVLVELTSRIDERKAAAILAAMQPDRARDLTARLAESRMKKDGGT